jgi:hypothetical protein
VGLNGRSGRPKTCEAAEERPYNQGDETNPIVSAGRTFGGFLPKKKPAQSGAGRVGEGSHRAALKTRNPPGGFRRAYFCILIITTILEREGENVNGLHYAQQNPLTTAVKSRGCPRGCGTLRWREQNSAGHLSARAPSNERSGRRRDPAPLARIVFKTRARGPFPDPVGNFPDTLI